MSQALKVPSYRLHKQLGQAIVTLTGGLGQRRDVLLGKHGTTESRQEYACVIAEWEANGRQLTLAGKPGSQSINELLLAFWQQRNKWCQFMFRPAAAGRVDSD
jgi:hypothetical protein